MTPISCPIKSVTLSTPIFLPQMVLEDEHRFRGAVKQVIEQYSNMPPPAADGDFFGGLGDLSGLKPKKGEDGVDDLPEDDSNEL